MTTLPVPVGAILRLEGDGETIVTIPAQTKLQHIFPSVVAINTFGLTKEQLFPGDYFVAPRPGYYRFNSITEAQTEALGLYLFVAPDKQYIGMTYGPSPVDSPRIQAQLPSTIVWLETGTAVSRDLYNRSDASADVWPQPESNSFTVEYLGE